MECEITALVSAYVDGELAEAEARRVEAHLETCARCRAALDAFRLLGAGVDALPPAGDAGSRRRALDNVLANVLAAARPPLWRRPVSVTVPAAAAVVLAVATGSLLVGRSLSPSAPVPAPGPAAELPAAPVATGGPLSRFDRGGRAAIAVLPNVDEAGDAEVRR
jgi:anti-sigma factor RsiW